MRFSKEFGFRIVGAMIGAVLFGVFGASFATELGRPLSTFIVVFTMLGFLSGLILTPYLTIRPARLVRKNLAVMPPEKLAAFIVGLLLGLIAAALFALPLSMLPTPFREILPIASAIAISYISVTLMMMRHKDLRQFFGSFGINNQRQTGHDARPVAVTEDIVLLDTSVIIDGRIADVYKTGFIRAMLLVPTFVLSELQHIADSADALRRNRGRRGLEILSILQEDSPLPVRITDMDITEVREVDSKLVALARHLHCPIMTNDYNLGRVAEIQGVAILNINDLSNAIRALYLPGEELTIKIIQVGKEDNQGVGFLEDGTMVVVEDGHYQMNRTVAVIVTKVLQTSAGRMIFARLK